MTFQGIILKLKQSLLGDLFRFARSCILRLTTPSKSKGTTRKKNQIVYLSDGKKATFFGYHDKTPFNADGTKILAMSVPASDTNPESECTPLKLGYFCKTEDGFGQEFISFAQTTTWCWQQGCMLQWHPLHADSQVFFNALVNGSYGSVLFDISQGQKLREYDYPIYSIDPTGRYATTLNFSRLGRLRPGYGYGLLADETVSDPAPKDDGLFIFSLSTGEKGQFISLQDLAHTVGAPAAQHYINHATFSPDGSRIVFFHLWSQGRDKNRGFRVCEVDPVTGHWREVETERLISHYCWCAPYMFLATTREKSGRWHYALYDIAANTRTDLDLPFNQDGHPMFHPTNKNLIVTDTYPDKRRDQHLCIVNLETKEIQEIATLYSPFRYRGQVRCDLHPRWCCEGNLILVDSTQTGVRTITVFVV